MQNKAIRAFAEHLKKKPEEIKLEDVQGSSEGTEHWAKVYDEKLEKIEAAKDGDKADPKAAAMQKKINEFFARTKTKFLSTLNEFSPNLFLD